MNAVLPSLRVSRHLHNYGPLVYPWEIIWKPHCGYIFAFPALHFCVVSLQLISYFTSTSWYQQPEYLPKLHCLLYTTSLCVMLSCQATQLCSFERNAYPHCYYVEGSASSKTYLFLRASLAVHKGKAVAMRTTARVPLFSKLLDCKAQRSWLLKMPSPQSLAARPSREANLKHRAANPSRMLCQVSLLSPSCNQTAYNAWSCLCNTSTFIPYSAVISFGIRKPEAQPCRAARGVAVISSLLRCQCRINTEPATNHRNVGVFSGSR